MIRNFEEKIVITHEENGEIHLKLKSDEYVDPYEHEKMRSFPFMPVSIAASIANMHPQTVRQYDRLGLVVPRRTKGKGRRYSIKNVERLLNIQRMSRDGVNLEGIRRIIELEEEKEKLLIKLKDLQTKVDAVDRVFTADSKGCIHTLKKGVRYSNRCTDHNPYALVIWKPDL